MRPMLHPQGFEETYDDQVIVENPPSSPWAPIIAFVLILAMSIVTLMWVARSLDPAPASPPPTTNLQQIGN